MSMTRTEIAEKAEALRAQQAAMPQMVPSSFIYAKYAKLEKELRQIINDMAVLIRELAWQEPPAPPTP